MSQKPAEPITPIRDDNLRRMERGSAKAWDETETLGGAFGLGFELDVPIRVADDALPRRFAWDLGEKKLRAPTRYTRPAQKPKPSLLNQTISLLEIAVQAGDD